MVGLGAPFAFTRLADDAQQPVGGAELDALSEPGGRRTATATAATSPILFQGVTALSFSFTTSECWHGCLHCSPASRSQSRSTGCG